ncbi:hypothetical protein D3C87_280290 [compost metagenome]
MGYDFRGGGIGGKIKTFWPDDDADTMYVGYATTLAEISQKAKEKWGDDVSLEDLEISADHIHTDCIGYDRYDSDDYTNFIVIAKAKR